MSCYVCKRMQAHTLYLQTHRHTHTRTFILVSQFLYSSLIYWYYAMSIIFRDCIYRCLLSPSPSPASASDDLAALATTFWVGDWNCTVRVGENWKGRGSWRQALRQKQLQRRRQASNYFVNTLDTPATTASGAYSLQVCPLRPAQDIHKSIRTLVCCCFITQVKCCGWRQEIAMKCNVTWKCKCRGDDSVCPPCKPQVGVARACPGPSVCACVCKAESRQVLEPNEIT